MRRLQDQGILQRALWKKLAAQCIWPPRKPPHVQGLPAVSIHEQQVAAQNNDESIWISFVSARAGREESHWINSVSAPHVGEFVMCAAHHCAKTFSQQHGVLVLKEIHEGCN